MDIHKIEIGKKRIAFIMDTWFPVHTGEQVYTAKLAMALADLYGYEVDIFTRDIAGKLTAEQKAVEDSPAIRIKRFGSKSHPWNIFMQMWFVVAVFFKLIFAGKKYSIYHAHTATSAIPMKIASWFTRVPTILTVHGNNVFDRAWTLRKIIHRVMFLETKYTSEVSISESFLKAKNINENVLIIPYGVDTAQFEAVNAEKSPEQFNVLFVGRLDFIKGVDILLNATKKVIDSNGFIQSHKDFQLHLVGAGPDRKDFEKLATKLGISKYVRFHGLVTGDDLIKIYKSADLFVLPSRSEAVPFAVLEACAAELPVLATNVGDLRRLVIENTNGHLVEMDDSDDLAYYLEQFACNPALAAMGKAGFDLVSQEYTWDSTVQKMLRVYDSVLRAYEKVEVAFCDTLIKPWRLPIVLWKSRVARKIYKSKSPIKFCFTMDLESEESFDTLLERFTEFCSGLSMPSTIFVSANLFENFAEEILNLQDSGFEIGIKLTENDWNILPNKKKAIRNARELLDRMEIKNVRMLRAPSEISNEALSYAHENGFEYLPTSDDPDPKIIWKYFLPFGKIVPMTLETFLSLEDSDLLKSVKRLVAFQKHYSFDPFMIFQCNDDDFVTGENFTELSKKLAGLREHFDFECMTLSDFCKSCKTE